MNPQFRRLVLDLGPLLIFFASYTYLGIFKATAVFMVTVAIALALDWLFERKLSPVPLFTAIFVGVMGGLTLYLQNSMFIKIKPTILYAFFGLLLLAGLRFNRLFIKYVFAQAFELSEAGWRKLTVRWGAFFLCLAVLNEIVWRSTSEANWVKFKVFGILPLIFLFALAQTPLVLKHQLPVDKPDGDTQD
jgi:intracellular septation protein